MSALDWLTGGWRPGSGELLLSAPGWQLALGGLAILAAMLLAWRSARGVAGRGLQLVLLIPVALALLWALVRPIWVEESVQREEGRFVLLIDDSRSMAVLEDGAPRHEALPQVLAAIGHEDADRYVFGAELLSGREPGWQQGGTDLGAALRALAERYAGERLTGIALVSDGIDRGALRQDWVAGSGIPELELPGPLTVYGVGVAESLADLAVEDVAVGGFAFIRAPFPLRAVISGPGFEGRRVPVTLTCDGSLVARKTVTLDAEGRAEAQFSVTPKEVGRHTYEVALPADQADAIPSNNSQAVVVRVVRDRMRVLQVCGSPSMDQKFLRRFLKQDPAVDLVSFFILRTHEDMGAGYDDDELALIPFPYDRLFSEDLWSFDLIIFQNFDYEPYFSWNSQRLLANIADYVRQGGAFVMVGGDRSFDLGKYQETAIADILPVALGAGGEAADVAAFLPVLTEAGRRHPVTALAGDAAESALLWEGLSALDGLNLSRGPAAGAAVLLAHPSLRARGEPMPVLAVKRVGQGRSMAFMGDSSWRWAFAEAARGKGNQTYLRFWKNAMRWLVGDPEAQQVRVETSRENYRVGEEVRAVVRVRDVAFQPRAGVAVRGVVQRPAMATAQAIDSELLADDGSFELRSDGNGEAIVSFVPKTPGAWRLQVRVAGQEEVSAFEGGTVFAVTAREPELSQIVPDMAFLAALAESAGGAYHAPGQAGAPLEDPQAGRQLRELRETPLWDIPLVPLLVGLFASLSWWVRRRGGGR